MPHPINETYGMEDILLLIPQGAYIGKVPKVEEYIDRYRDQSAGAIKFAYNTTAAAAGAEMGTNKEILDLIRRPPPSNVWQTHLFKATGDNKAINDFTIHDIIQSIKTESTKTGSKGTKMGLLKFQSAPNWSEYIRTYSAAITKN